LDEADLLGDHIAILAAPGKLVASGSPVALKREFGEGYSVQVIFGDSKDADQLYGYSSSSFQLLHAVRQIAADTYVTNPSPSISIYHLRTKDNAIVGSVLHLMEREMQKNSLKSYDILGTTIEDIFLKVMSENDVKSATWTARHSPSSSVDSLSIMHATAPTMDLPNGKPVSPFRQAFTIFHKRVLIARRSWITPLLAIIIAITGTTIPLTYITGHQLVCVPKATDMTATPLFLPLSPLGSVNRMVVSPPGLLSDLGSLTSDLLVTNAPDGGALISDIRGSPATYSLGGISLDSSGEAVVAWEASPPGIRAPAMLNMASNLLYNRALNISSGGTSSSAPPSLIISGYATFAKVSADTLMYIRWVFFFGAVMVSHIYLQF
jgi:ATP-binding cassette subfamily A (ABC1) protein 3